MIFGSLKITAAISPAGTKPDKLSCPGLLFHPVTLGEFSGGWYCHPDLPYCEEDAWHHDTDNDIAVLLSGTVYNRQELTGDDEIKKSEKDPVLIARLFLEHGPVFAADLNGDFSIFIYRPLRHEAFLFRDHLGIMPLGYTVADGMLHFSGDIAGLAREFCRDEPVDSELLLSYFKYTDNRKTPCGAVKKFPPGHYMHCTGGGSALNKYWDPEAVRTDRSLTREGMLNGLDFLLRDAVRIRCDSRFTAGAHVSSGIDSGVVAALARKEYGDQEQFHGFSWSPSRFDAPEGSLDERSLVKATCAVSGIEPHFSQLSLKAYLRYLSRSWHNGGYFIEDETSDMAAELGVNLLFTGWGGDEFISTGHSGIDLDLLRRLKLRLYFRRNPPGRPRQFIRRLLFYVICPSLHILHPGSAGGFRRDAKYIVRHFAVSDRGAIRNFYFHGSRRRMHLNIFRFYNIPERCESWYMLGLRKGVEYRYPLLDRRIVEFMLKVPSELLCAGGLPRPVLRELGSGLLPDEVRLNEDKSDPVFWAHMGSLFREAAVCLMDEAEGWKDNRDMKFVDFSLLLDDIARFRSGETVPDENVLFKTIVWLKAIHEYTSRYREEDGR